MRYGASRRRRLSKHDGTNDSPECNYEILKGSPFIIWESCRRHRASFVSVDSGTR